MGNFTSKFADRKIGPKFFETINQNFENQVYKPRLHEEKNRLRPFTYVPTQ